MSPTTKLALLGGTLAATIATTATAGSPLAGSYVGGPYAGDCGPTAFDCAPDVWVSSTDAVRDEVLLSIDQPYGHLRSVDYRRSPAVSITRLHDQGTMPGLGDFPSGFVGGCDAVSTQYCRQGGLQPVAQPQVRVQPPMIAAPFRPAVVAVVAAPQPRLRQWTASFDDDPARFAPRQYGSLDFVPGIAHVPSSWVDRSPAAAQAALDASGAGGLAPGPQTGLSRIPDDTPGPLLPFGQLQGAAPVLAGSTMQPGPASLAPALPVAPGSVPFGANVFGASVHPTSVHGTDTTRFRAPVMQAPAFGPAFGAGVSPLTGVALPNLAPSYPARPGAPVAVGNGTYASQVGADGTYWEQVSGVQLVGDTVVSKVLCKRALQTEVVNPVVGVPQPFAVPVGCEAGVPHAAHGPYAPHSRGLAGGY